MKIMKGGGDNDLIILLVICCCCFCLSIFGGIGIYFMSQEKECEDDSDCASGTNASKTKCNSSGVCVEPEHLGGNSSDTHSHSNASATAPTDGGPHVDGPRSPCEQNNASYCGSDKGHGYCYPSDIDPVHKTVCKCAPGFKYKDNASGCVEDMNWDLPMNNKFFYGDYDNEDRKFGYKCMYGDIIPMNYFTPQGVCKETKETNDKDNRVHSYDSSHSITCTDSGIGTIPIFEAVDEEPLADPTDPSNGPINIINHCFTHDEYEKLTNIEKTNLQAHLGNAICDENTAGGETTYFYTCKKIVDYFNNEFINDKVNDDRFDATDDVPGINQEDKKYYFGLNRYKINEGKVECRLEEDKRHGSDNCLRAPPTIVKLQRHINDDYGNNASGTINVEENKQISEIDCKDRQLGSLCQIKEDEYCGRDNDIQGGPTQRRNRIDAEDPLFGYKIRYDKEADDYKIKSNYEGSIYFVPIEDETQDWPTLQDHKYGTCDCKSETPHDRRGMVYTGFRMDPNKFCTCPISSDHSGSENTADIASLGDSPWQVLYFNPNKTFGEQNLISGEPNIIYESMYNTRCYLDCGKKPFTLGNVDSEDGGFQTGNYYEHNYGQVPDCKICPRASHPGTNQTKINRYFGWSDSSDRPMFDTIYTKLSAGEENNGKEILVNDDEILTFKDMFKDFSTDLRGTCKPAYPKFYGTIGKFRESNNASWSAGYSDTEYNNVEGTKPPNIGGEYAGELRVTDTRPVPTGYIIREKPKINTLNCPEGRTLNWTPEKFITVSADNVPIGVEQCEIKDKIRPVRFGQPQPNQGWNRTIWTQRDTPETTAQPPYSCDVGRILPTEQCQEIIEVDKNILWRHYESRWVSGRDNELWDNDNIVTAYNNIKAARDNTIANVVGFDADKKYHLVAVADPSVQTNNGDILTGTWPAGEGTGFDTQFGRDRLGYNEAASACGFGMNDRGDPFAGGCGGRAAVGAYWEELTT